MALIFTDATGLSVESVAEVRQQVAAMFQQAFAVDENTPTLNVEPETPAGQLVDGITALLMLKDNELLKLANMFNPLTATGVYQDALGQIYFIQRLTEQPTTVTCLCRGLYGTVIPAGSIVSDVSGNRYISTAAATIGSDGTANVIFACTEPGAVQCNTGTVNKIITVIPGWDSVTNEAAGVPGRVSETQSQFEARRFASVAKNSHGLAESVGGSIANLQDVIASKIVQNRTGQNQEMYGVTVPPHSIYLSVYGGTPKEIGQVIYNKLDAGCGTAGNTSVIVTDPVNGSQNVYYYTVPTPVSVYVQVTTAPEALYNQEAVTQAILDNFNGQTDAGGLVAMGETLFASRFYQTVIDAGLTDLVQIQVSLTSGSGYGLSVDFALDEMPTLSADNITYVEAEA